MWAWKAVFWFAYSLFGIRQLDLWETDDLSILFGDSKYGEYLIPCSHSISLETRSSVFVRLPQVVQCLLEVVLVLRFLWRSAMGGQRQGFLEHIAATSQIQSETVPIGQEKKSTSADSLVSPLKFILSKASSYTTLTSLMSLVLFTTLYHRGG